MTACDSICGASSTCLRLITGQNGRTEMEQGEGEVGGHVDVVDHHAQMADWRVRISRGCGAVDAGCDGE
jgi:hypothetical protein